MKDTKSQKDSSLHSKYIEIHKKGGKAEFKDKINISLD